MTLCKVKQCGFYHNGVCEKYFSVLNQFGVCSYMWGDKAAVTGFPLPRYTSKIGANNRRIVQFFDVKDKPSQSEQYHQISIEEYMTDIEDEAP